MHTRSGPDAEPKTAKKAMPCITSSLSKLPDPITPKKKLSPPTSHSSGGKKDSTVKPFSQQNGQHPTPDNTHSRVMMINVRFLL
mmetsp:Transcript_37642/g.80357  ORF Transcript_37642/g.80357 Transcript_37642/m.80357 type:complete len:84 (-) Transcript_37642:514-765(-)